MAKCKRCFGIGHTVVIMPGTPCKACGGTGVEPTTKEVNA